MQRRIFPAYRVSAFSITIGSYGLISLKAYSLVEVMLSKTWTTLKEDTVMAGACITMGHEQLMTHPHAFYATASSALPSAFK
jgi:hypothetical protein